MKKKEHRLSNKLIIILLASIVLFTFIIMQGSGLSSSTLSLMPANKPDFTISFSNGSYYAKSAIAEYPDFSDPNFAKVFDHVIQSLKENKRNGTVRTIYLPSKVYAVPSDLVVDVPNVEIYGNDNAAELDSMDSNINIINIMANNIRIHDLHIRQIHGTGKGIFISKPTANIHIYNNRIDNTYLAIYSIGSQNNIEIRDNSIFNGGDGSASIMLINSSGRLGNGVIITGNKITNSTRHAIEIYSSGTAGIQWSNVTVSDNIITNSVQAGIFLAETTNAIVKNNKIYGAGAEALDFEHSTFIKIQENTIVSNHYVAISILSLQSGKSNNIEIMSNDITTTTTSHPEVLIDNADKVNIEENIINTPNDAIQPIGDINDLFIKGNVLKHIMSGSGEGVRLDLGEGKTARNIIIENNNISGFGTAVNFHAGGIFYDVTLTNNDLRQNRIAIVLNSLPTPFSKNDNIRYSLENLRHIILNP